MVQARRRIQFGPSKSIVAPCPRPPSRPNVAPCILEKTRDGATCLLGDPRYSTEPIVGEVAAGAIDLAAAEEVPEDIPVQTGPLKFPPRRFPRSVGCRRGSRRSRHQDPCAEP